MRNELCITNVKNNAFSLWLPQQGIEGFGIYGSVTEGFGGRYLSTEVNSIAYWNKASPLERRCEGHLWT